MGENNYCDYGIIRELRRQQDMSIQELSRRSGLSASVISKLERNCSSPEADTLYRIARVFGMTLADFFMLAEKRNSHLCGEEQYASGDFAFRRISYANMRCMMGSAPAGAALAKPELHRDDFELCWVLQGRLRIELPDEFHELAAGEAIQFDALLHHTYKVLEDCKFLLIHLRKPKRF